MVRARKTLRPRTASSLRPFGLTVDEWQEMLAQGGGRCWICGKGGLTKHLSVDHDHTLAKAGAPIRSTVRGLLCQRCNRALGAWEWSDEVLDRAVKYLQRISLTRSEMALTVTSDMDNRSPEGAAQKGDA